MPSTMPNMPNEQEDPGFFTKAASNPYVMLPYAILSGIGSAADPSLARGFRGVNSVAQLGAEYERYARERRRKQKISEAMAPIIGAGTEKKTTAPGIDLSQAELTLPQDQRVSSIYGNGSPLSPAKPLPTYEKTEKTPSILSPAAQAYTQALLKAGDIQGAQAIVNRAMTQKPEAPQRHYEVKGALINPETLQPDYVAPPEAVKETWRPYNIDLGDRIESGVVSSTGRKAETVVRPKGRAPEKPESEIDTKIKNARLDQIRQSTQESRAREGRIGRLVKIAGSPKATLGQLSASLNALVRERDSFETPESEKADIQDAIRIIREKIIGRGTGKGTAVPTGADGAMEKMPDAGSHKGRIVRDTATGQRFQSDGDRWAPIDTMTEY